MSAWTNGKLHVVVGPVGLSVHRGERAELILSSAQLGGPLAGKKSKVARSHPLAVTADGKIAYTIDAERKLIRAALEPGGPTFKFPWEISDLAPADGPRLFVAYVSGTKARALASVAIGVPPADPKGKWELEFEAERPTKVEWPDELLWDKAQWSRKTRWTIEHDLLLVDANPYGFTVYDTDSAVVGVLRRPAPSTLPAGFNAIHRTPKDKGTTVAATTTARGVLVATCKPDGAAVICEFDDEGKLLAHRKLEATAIGPLTHAGERVFALVHLHARGTGLSDLHARGTGLSDLHARGTGLSDLHARGTGLSDLHARGTGLEQRKLAILGLDLATQAELELPALPPAQARLRAGPDGASFVLALADKVLEGTLIKDGGKGGKGGWSLRELDLSTVPDPGKAHEAAITEAAVEVVEEPTVDGKPIDLRTRIITQAPRLDLDPNQPNEAWQFVLGEELEIVLNAVSVGGPAETGLYVEVSGAALDKGLVEPQRVDIEGQNRGQAIFEKRGQKRVATLPDIRVPAGVEPIRDKKIKPKERFLDNPEDTFLTIRLRGRVNKLGANELLFVRVGFEQIGQEGSLMRGRPVSVFTTRPEPPAPEPPAHEPTSDPDSQP